MLRLIGFALLLLSSKLGNGQQVTHNDSTGINAEYNKKITAAGDLFYGTEHIPYQPYTEGFAYFDSPDWMQGSVTYNGVLYQNLLLKYDLIKDELIVLHPNNVFAVTLFNERVQSFAIGNNHFIYIKKNDKSGLKPGYYHQLVSGKLSILSKRSKVIEEKTTTQVEKRIVSRDQFYAIHTGISTLVRNEDSIMEITGNLSGNIRKLLRSKDLKFRSNKELVLIEIATYYNQSAQ